MNANISGKILFEISLESKSRSYETKERLRQVFESLDVSPMDIVEKEEKRAYGLLVYVPSKSRADALLKQIKQLKLRNIFLRLKILRDKDWQEKWKTNIRPFRLTKNFDVVPAWCKKDYKPTGRTPLYIDTTMAFGTGLHETTRFMAQLIDECQGQFETFLDVGTGTGLLSLLAYHCGAKEVWAIDIDGESIRVAKENLAANGYRLDKTLTSDFADAAKSLNKRFDFVAANLVTEDLITLRFKILGAVNSGKFLAVSGISLPNLKKLQKMFQGLPLRCRKVIKGKQWAAILYQRELNPKKVYESIRRLIAKGRGPQGPHAAVGGSRKRF
jgi:ribosomal protein L11 methyltransferase